MWSYPFGPPEGTWEASNTHLLKPVLCHANHHLKLGCVRDGWVGARHFICSKSVAKPLASPQCWGGTGRPGDSSQLVFPKCSHAELPVNTLCLGMWLYLQREFPVRKLRWSAGMSFGPNPDDWCSCEKGTPRLRREVIMHTNKITRINII